LARVNVTRQPPSATVLAAREQIISRPTNQSVSNQPRKEVNKTAGEQMSHNILPQESHLMPKIIAR